MKTHVLIVTHNNTMYLRNLVNDLKVQTHPHKLTIVDQASTDPQLHSFYNTLKDIEIIKNDFNKPLNHIWNWFAEYSQSEYLAYLNNDIRIRSNFIKSSEELFEKENDVAITIHSTNNPEYVECIEPLNYVILNEAWQGWDFTIRRKEYPQIDKDLKWFGGDCWIYRELIKKHKRIGMILNSPVFHHLGRTNIKDRKQFKVEDSKIKVKQNLVNPTRLNVTEGYSIIKPTKQFKINWEKHNEH